MISTIKPWWDYRDQRTLVENLKEIRRINFSFENLKEVEDEGFLQSKKEGSLSI